jgi:aspartyl protease family protein
MLPFLPVVIFVSSFEGDSSWPITAAPITIASSAAPQSCSAPSAEGLSAAFSQPFPALRLSGGVKIVTMPATAPSMPHSLWRSDDGLFYVDAEINGASVHFLVDTGASMIVLTAEDARRVGAAPSDYSLSADTAAGKSKMAKVTLANMRVGATSAEAVPAAVAQKELGVSLLGQNWLSHLASVTIEGDRMILN